MCGSVRSQGKTDLGENYFVKARRGARRAPPHFAVEVGLGPRPGVARVNDDVLWILEDLRAEGSVRIDTGSPSAIVTHLHAGDDDVVIRARYDATSIKECQEFLPRRVLAAMSALSTRWETFSLFRVQPYLLFLAHVYTMPVCHVM